MTATSSASISTNLRPAHSSSRLGRNVWILFGCQALGATINSVQVVAGTLIGYSLAVNKSLGSLPLTLQVTATMAAAVPAVILFERLGRRHGFLLGALASLLGCLLFAAGVWRSDFTLYCIGAVPTGLGIGIAQHLRFAASEAVGPKQQTRALALVMSGGIVAAVAGPELVTLTKDLFVPALFFGTYLCLAVLPIVTALLLAALEQPPVATRAVPTILIRGVLQRRDFLVAAATSMVAFAGMNLIGTSLPIQMTLCGFGISDSATVLGLHGIAMFAPGFITGRLIEAFGPHRVIATGAVLNLGCAALAFAGSAYLSFAIALILLGLGWNMMFTGATALLARSHGPENRVQAANDFLMFGGVAFATFGSGVLESAFGWGAVNMAFVPMMVLGLGLVLWHRACGPPGRLATTA